MKLNEIAAVEYHKTLNPKIWDDFSIKPEVEQQLFKIAKKFIEFLAIDNSFIEDLILTGSNCNFNWTKDSDIDLHVVVSYEDFQKGCKVADVTELFNSKKTLWNDSHDITIYDIPVELYVQDGVINDSKDGVVYSLSKRKWIVLPKKYEKISIDEEKINKIYKKLKSLIEKSVKDGDKTKIESIKNAIADMRKNALETEGEFSAENIAYKRLRKNKIMHKLWDASTELDDENLSL